MNTESVRTVLTESPEEGEELGAVFGRTCTGGELLVLEGELGAGKTAFVRGFLRGLGGDPRAVRSPSYTLHHRHEGRRVLHHLDVYFTESYLDLERTPLREFLEAGDVVVVEWGQRFAAELPKDRVLVELEHRGPTRRLARIQARGPSAERWCQSAERELRSWSSAGEAPRVEPPSPELR